MPPPRGRSNRERTGVSLLKLPFLVALALAIAFSGGIASSRYALDHVRRFDALKIGPWEAWPDLQTVRADPYELAYRAREGRILLGEAEGLAFTATTDSDGEGLSGRCRYIIAGTTPAARLWTLRVADRQGRPFATRTDVLPRALHSHDVLRDSEGSFRILVSREAQAGNWIALDHAGPVEFVLTLFDTPAAGNAGLIKLAMPTIRRIGCGDA